MKMETMLLAFQSLVFAVLMGVVIYLVIRRVRIKQEEDFEDRDN